MKLIRQPQQNLDLTMPIHERPFDTLEQFDEAELEQRKLMFESGTPIAAIAAVAYCDEHSLYPPRWAVAESLKIQLAAIRGDKPGRQGRSSGIRDRYRQDAIDYIRWDMVIQVREACGAGMHRANGVCVRTAAYRQTGRAVNARPG